MSFVLVLYFLVITLLVYVLYCLLNQNKIRHVYERYLITALGAIVVWICIYASVFFFVFDSVLDVFRTKILYFLGVFMFYSMLAFFYFYGNKTQEKYRWFHISFIAISLLVFGAIVGTNNVIESVYYNQLNGESYEVFGRWYSFLNISHLLSIILFIILTVYKIKNLSGLYRIRYGYIAGGYFIMIVFQIFFLSVLPLLDIWLLQQEQIIFFIPFILGLLYAIHRYQFRKISFGIGQGVIFIFSGVLAGFFVFASKNMLSLLDASFLTFWSLSDSISWGDIIVGNIFFYSIHRYLQQKFKVYHDSGFILEKQLSTMKAQIPFLQNPGKLNSFLESQFSQKMRIPHASVISGNKLSEISQIVEYFQSEGVNSFFLNDRVFIEENKHRFSLQKITQQLDSNTTLYIPMYKNKNEILGVLCVGAKPFGDYYKLTEMNLLQEFAEFLTGHLSYMNIYTQINELNLTLDKRVDEKTIAYNDLINKQREFISYVAHEIRNPVTNTIFLCYDLQEKIEEFFMKHAHGDDIKKDMGVLSDELKKISDLSKDIFTNQKIELGKTKLYKTHVNLRDFLQSEISVLEINNSHVIFDTHLRDVGLRKIDEVQFRQVIQNLLSNALKFIPIQQGKISIELKNIDTDNVHIIIQDNGKGLDDISNADVFDKYRTGNHESSGLGMGLYLCKKIVELHGGTIASSSSAQLGGAQFSIIL